MFWAFAWIIAVLLSIMTVNPIPIVLCTIIYAAVSNEQTKIDAAGPDYESPLGCGCASLALTVAMGITMLLVLGLFAFGEEEMIRMIDGMNP